MAISRHEAAPCNPTVIYTRDSHAPCGARNDSIQIALADCHCEERSDVAISRHEAAPCNPTVIYTRDSHAPCGARNDRQLCIMYFVYILANKSRSTVYTGVTKDLQRRVYEHKSHFDLQSFSARYNVDRLVYYEAVSDSYAAISREKQIKKWNRERKNELIESFNPNWLDLYDAL